MSETFKYSHNKTKVLFQFSSFFNFSSFKILNKSKAFQDIDIPTRITKENSDILGDFWTSNFNKCNVNSIFPALLKLANMSPAHKERSKNLHRYYRPVSIL